MYLGAARGSVGMVLKSFFPGLCQAESTHWVFAMPTCYIKMIIQLAAQMFCGTSCS